VARRAVRNRRTTTSEDSHLAESRSFTSAPRPSPSDRYLKRPLHVKIQGFTQDLLDSFLRIDGMGLAKQISYSVVFALVPTLFLLVAVGTLVEELLDVPVTRGLRNLITDYAPDASRQLLLDAVDSAITDTSIQTASISGLIALGLALWAGMGGVGTLVEATNRAYGVRNTRPWYMRRLMTLTMTVALTLLVVFSVLISFFGDLGYETISRALGNPRYLEQLDQTGQDLVTIGTTFTVLLLLYRYAPSVEHTWRWSTPGAVLSTLAWIGLLEITGFIARRLDYGNLFGAAGGFLLMMYLLNFAGVVLIAGAVLNGVLGQRYDLKRRRDLAQHPEKIRYVETGQEIKPDPFSVPIRLPRR
jgi:membrane protein